MNVMIIPTLLGCFFQMAFHTEQIAFLQFFFNSLPAPCPNPVFNLVIAITVMKFEIIFRSTSFASVPSTFKIFCTPLRFPLTLIFKLNSTARVGQNQTPRSIRRHVLKTDLRKMFCISTLSALRTNDDVCCGERKE